MQIPQDKKQILDDIRRLLMSQKLMVLSTYGSGRSHSSLVCFVSTDDLRYLVFATSRNTRKFANIQSNPMVSMLVDNRTNREQDIHSAAAVTISGRAGEADSVQYDRFQTLYLAEHPYLEAFVRSSSCALIQVAVDTFSLVTKFQNVREIHIDQNA